MGMAAAELSDIVVLTSDNPRSEDPLSIMNDAMVGIRRFDTPHIVEPDREKAIRRAIESAGPGDVVLLAGKGHETYQVLKDRTIAFDDREVARNILGGLVMGKKRREMPGKPGEPLPAADAQPRSWWRRSSMSSMWPPVKKRRCGFGNWRTRHHCGSVSLRPRARWERRPRLRAKCVRSASIRERCSRGTCSLRFRAMFTTGTRFVDDVLDSGASAAVVHQDLGTNDPV